MALSTAARETAALAIAGLGTFISAHTADPGTTGASEASGGSPAYARQATTWAGGVVDGAVPGSQVTFNLPAGTYGFFGIWTAATGGTFIGGGTINPGTLSAQAQIKVTPTISAT